MKEVIPKTHAAFVHRYGVRAGVALDLALFAIVVVIAALVFAWVVQHA